MGANHEMNRELLWRRYPTDRRGTPFHRFWDRARRRRGHRRHPRVPRQLRPRHQLGRRPARLAGAAGARPAPAPLPERGGVRRSPPVPTAASTRRPARWRTRCSAGRIDPDVTFVGFDLTARTVEVAPGWYFVIAEQPTEPRFGLDVPPPSGGGAAPASWSDLDWGDVGVAPGGHLRIAASGLDGQDKPIADPSGPAANVAPLRQRRRPHGRDHLPAPVPRRHPQQRRDRGRVVRHRADVPPDPDPRHAAAPACGRRG